MLNGTLSRMLGSLTNYRRLLREHVFAPRLGNGLPDPNYKLMPFGHGIAGMFAGWTVSLIAAPIEHVKARLQIQYAADKSKRLYSGPIDCSTKIVCFILPQTGFLRGMFSSCPSSVNMAFQASTVVSSQPPFSAPFSSSGGLPMISTLIGFDNTPLCLNQQ
jgi:transmembrane carrier protein